jgi:hypothetical protein
MTAPLHPAWCSSSHNPVVWPAHSAQLGDVDAGGGYTLFVELQQVPGEPVKVLLGQHTDEETSMLELSIAAAGGLFELFAAALELTDPDPHREPPAKQDAP